jgi:hypothetical protein
MISMWHLLWIIPLAFVGGVVLMRWFRQMRDEHQEIAI